MKMSMQAILTETKDIESKEEAKDLRVAYWQWLHKKLNIPDDAKVENVDNEEYPLNTVQKLTWDRPGSHYELSVICGTKDDDD